MHLDLLQYWIFHTIIQLSSWTTLFSFNVLKMSVIAAVRASCQLQPCNETASQSNLFQMCWKGNCTVIKNTSLIYLKFNTNTNNIKNSPGDAHIQCFSET